MEPKTYAMSEYDDYDVDDDDGAFSNFVVDVTVVVVSADAAATELL